VDIIVCLNDVLVPLYRIVIIVSLKAIVIPLYRADRGESSKGVLVSLYRAYTKVFSRASLSIYMRQIYVSLRRPTFCL
jgi:hypothetical protein